MVDIEGEGIKKYVFKNKSVSNLNKSNLIDFISNSKKFNFNSVFDHKGAKLFLKGKEKALKEIILDENFTDEISLESKKNKEKFINIPKMEITKNKPIIISSYKDKRMKKPKDIHDKKNIFKNSNGNEFKKGKHLSTPYISLSEINMFNDKQIKKLKPIKRRTFKNDTKFYSVNNIKQKSFNSIDYMPSDSTIIHLIHDMSNKAY